MRHAPVCMNCCVEMICQKVGVHLELMSSQGPYQLWDADLFQCKQCGAKVTSGFAIRPTAEIYEDSYEKWRTILQPTRFWITKHEKEQWKTRQVPFH